MTEQEITVCNRAGIHARPAAVLAETANDYKANIYLEKGQDRINAKSIMGIMALGAAYNTKLKIIAEGEDEKQLVEAFVRLFESKFEEE